MNEGKLQYIISRLIESNSELSHERILRSIEYGCVTDTEGLIALAEQTEDMIHELNMLKMSLLIKIARS